MSSNGKHQQDGGNSIGNAGDAGNAGDDGKDSTGSTGSSHYAADSGDGKKSPPGRKGKRGFAAMSEQQQREIASKGGQAAHQKGTAHEFDSEEARRAGQKGGEVVSRNRAHMVEIGRKGGESRQSAARAGKDAVATPAASGNRGGVSQQRTRSAKQGDTR